MPYRNLWKEIDVIDADGPCGICSNKGSFSKFPTNYYNSRYVFVRVRSRAFVCRVRQRDYERGGNCRCIFDGTSCNILPEATGAPHETFFTSKGMANEITFAILSRQVFCPCPPASKVMTKLRLTIKHKCAAGVRR